MKLFVISVAVHAHYCQGGQGIAVVEANDSPQAKEIAAEESTGWGDWSEDEAVRSCSIVDEIQGFERADSREPRLVSYGFVENA